MSYKIRMKVHGIMSDFSIIDAILNVPGNEMMGEPEHEPVTQSYLMEFEGQPDTETLEFIDGHQEYERVY